MTDRSAGPRCGNNPNTRLTPGDRKAVDDAKARLALQAAAKPYIERAAWVDFDPLMEVIASTVWKHCSRDSEDMPQLVCDDPRTIAAFAAAVARAHAAVPAPATDRAALSAKLWEIAEHHIVAEWICCEPLDPKHGLCAKGYAALEMTKSLLVDSPEAWNPNAPLLDAVLAVLPAPVDRVAVLRDAAEVAVRAARGCGDSEAGQYAASVAAGIGKELRRMADEQPEAEAGCSQCGHRACMGRGRCGVVMTSEAGIVRPPCQCLGATPAAAVQQPKGARPPTAYSDGKGRTYCLPCAPAVGADVPLTINDVGHWDLCPSCGRYVVDVARDQTQPKEARP